LRAVVIARPGGREVLELREIEDPRPARGELLVRVAFAGANWSDIQKRQGVYPDPVDYPAIPGLEISGHVADKGPGVRGFEVGERVAAITGPRGLGGQAERVTVPASYAVRLPEAIDLALGAAFPVVALTAYHLLHSAYRLRRNQCVLVHAIGGGVGLMLTQMARHIGARVLGTVGRAGKGERALEYGAERVIDRSREDFVAVALETTGGRGVDLVIDSLGADVLPRSFDALRTYGHVINIGEAAGYPDFPVRPKLYERSTFLGGFELLHAKPGSARWRRGVRSVVDGFASGRLRLPIEGVYSLEQCAALHARLESRTVSGKLLLEMEGKR